MTNVQLGLFVAYSVGIRKYFYPNPILPSNSNQGQIMFIDGNCVVSRIACSLSRVEGFGSGNERAIDEQIYYLHSFSQWQAAM